MKSEDAIKILAQTMVFLGRKNSKSQLMNALNHAINVMRGDWIPVITKKMNKSKMKLVDEFPERVNFLYGVMEWNDSERWIYCSELPANDEEVLITTKEGFIDLTTFHIYENNCCEFNGYEERDDIIAWMPAPKKYEWEDKK